jgi:hypothetical protein
MIVISFFCLLKEPGGILVAAKDSFIQLQNPVLTSHSLSVTVIDARLNMC